MPRDADRGERRRVSANVRKPILAFFRLHRIGDTFHGDELERYVRACVPCRAESVQRIMRDLRSANAVNYRCVSRPESLYEILPLEPTGPVQEALL